MNRRIVYVPLDDRPPSRVFPGRLIDIAGLHWISPPRNLLGRFTRPADPENVFEWLEQSLQMGDTLVASADMLCYGGLVASRDRGVAMEEALARSDRLSCLKRRFGLRRLYCASVIPRLTGTAASQSDLKSYNALFRLSQFLDPDDQPGEGESEERAELLAQFPDETLSHYLNSRARNLAVNVRLVEETANGAIDFLLLLQEDCAARGIHRFDQRELARAISAHGVGDRALIRPGGDDGILSLVSLSIHESVLPSVTVRFCPSQAAGITPPYEDVSLDVSVPLIVRSCGGVLSPEPDGTEKPPGPGQRGSPLQLMVLGPGEPSYKASEIEGGESTDRDPMHRIAIADVIHPNGGSAEWLEWVSHRCDGGITRLASYAGWNTAANTVSTAVAHGLLTYLPDIRHAAHYRFLFERLVDDWLYQSKVRSCLNGELRRLGIDPLSLGQHTVEIERRVRTELRGLASELFDRLFRGIPCVEGTLDRLEELRVVLPWGRTFEAEISARLLCG